MTIGLMVLATPVTMIFCGEAYIPAIPVLYLNAPVIVLISLTNLMGIQILYPMDRVNLVIWSVTGAAIINCILNFILIPTQAANGAAIATLIAEFSVFCFQLAFGRRYYPFKISDIFNLKYIVSSLAMGISVFLISAIPESDILKLIFGISSGLLIYTIFLYVTKDTLFIEIISTLKNKFFHGLTNI